MSETCIYCGAPAVRWCDFVIGFTDADGDGLFSFDGGHEILRCDAGLCLAHARSGNMFISGEAPFAGHDTIDHCHTHPVEDGLVPTTMGDAERFRMRHRCSAYGGLRVATAQSR